jgi:TPR repeat protein
MGALSVAPTRALTVALALAACRDSVSKQQPPAQVEQRVSPTTTWDEMAGRAFEIWDRKERRGDTDTQQMFRDACDHGSQLGCAGLGTTYMSGDSAARDFGRGTKLLATACEARVGRACVSLAKAYEEGLGVARDRAKAAELSRIACDGGEQRGCVQYSRSMLFGDNGVAREPERSRNLAMKACESGVATGCTLAGLAYSSAFADPLEAQKWLRRGCDDGDGVGCAALATQYFSGGLPGDAKGVAVSPKLGAESAERACDLGEQKGCALLARAYANGEGVVQDLVRARQIAAKACSAADAAGCSLAAKIAMAEGKSDEATRFLERSCALGNRAACKR